MMRLMPPAAGMRAFHVLWGANAHFDSERNKPPFPMNISETGVFLYFRISFV